MNVEILAEAALFPEKEYISGIFVAVQIKTNNAHAITNKYYYESRDSDKLQDDFFSNSYKCELLC